MVKHFLVTEDKEIDLKEEDCKRAGLKVFDWIKKNKKLAVLKHVSEKITCFEHPDLFEDYYWAIIRKNRKDKGLERNNV